MQKNRTILRACYKIKCTELATLFCAIMRRKTQLVSGPKQTIFIPDYYRDEKYFVFLSLGDVPH
jgi:hypothetical protein